MRNKEGLEVNLAVYMFVLCPQMPATRIVNSGEMAATRQWLGEQTQTHTHTDASVCVSMNIHTTIEELWV
jgi:hypothetical protein